ncbi:hypothetical protein [Nonomuraea wenchangensis]|uniref:hypothetical protein n=1 Tax=Nonomuraea wenchangensis TaxID=568860 RepID=UPI00332184B6
MAETTSGGDSPATSHNAGNDSAGGPGRACRGYSRCDRRIVYTGAGRPREYCGPPDRVWEDGKTYKQKTHEERKAAHAASVDGALDLFDAAAAPVLAATTTLGDTLADLQRALEGHSEALAAVRDGAVARVREAEQTAADALTKAAAAEAERERAVRAAAAAEREREQAVEAKRVAESERERQVTAAWTRVVEHEAARAAAESKAADQTAAAVHAQQEQQKEWERAEQLQRSNRELEKANRELSEDLAVVRAQLTALEEARTAAETAAAQTRAETERLRAELD